MICSKCEKEFTPKSRNRFVCYTCRPLPNVKRTPAKKKQRDNRHCPYCGSYVQPGATFCNPNHRALFAERVADAKRGKPASVATPSPQNRGRAAYDRKSQRPGERAKREVNI